MADQRKTIRSALEGMRTPAGLARAGRAQGMSATPEAPLLRSAGKGLSYVFPAAGQALETLGEGRGLSNFDRGLAASDFVGGVGAGRAVGAGAQAVRRGIRSAIEKPVDRGRRLMLMAAKDRAGAAAQAAVVPALTRFVSKDKKTLAGKLSPEARAEMAALLGVAKGPVDRAVSRRTTGRLINPALPNPTIGRRSALKGIGALAATKAMTLPRLSPAGRAFDAVTGPLTKRVNRSVKPVRDAAVVRGLMEVGRKLEAPVSRRDVLRGIGAAGAARAAGL